MTRHSELQPLHQIQFTVIPRHLFVLSASYPESGCCTLICMHKHNDTIKTSATVLKKNIPLTLFERVVYERELKTEQNCHILTPTLVAISVSFPFSGVAQPEARGPSSLLGAVFSTASFLQLFWSPKNSWISCALTYIIVQRQLNLFP